MAGAVCLSEAEKDKGERTLVQDVAFENMPSYLLAVLHEIVEKEVSALASLRWSVPVAAFKVDYLVL